MEAISKPSPKRNPPLLIICNGYFLTGSYGGNYDSAVSYLNNFDRCSRGNEFTFGHRIDFLIAETYFSAWPQGGYRQSFFSDVAGQIFDRHITVFITDAVMKSEPSCKDFWKNKNCENFPKNDKPDYGDNDPVHEYFKLVINLLSY